MHKTMWNVQILRKGMKNFGQKNKMSTSTKRIKWLVFEKPTSSSMVKGRMLTEYVAE